MNRTALYIQMIKEKAYDLNRKVSIRQRSLWQLIAVLRNNRPRMVKTALSLKRRLIVERALIFGKVLVALANVT